MSDDECTLNEGESVVAASCEEVLRFPQSWVFQNGTHPVATVCCLVRVTPPQLVACRR
jgi:hypothetical protein